MSTVAEVKNIEITNHDIDACVEKMQGTRSQLKKSDNKQRTKAWKRGKAIKVEARVDYIKEKRSMQREENKRKEFSEKREEVLGELEKWKEDFFGMKKGKKFREKELEVREVRNNINDIVEERIITQHS